MARRKDAEQPQARTEIPEMLRGRADGLLKYVPAQDLIQPEGVPQFPQWFWHISQTRDLRLLAFAEWARLTGYVRPNGSPVTVRYPHHYSSSLRRAAVQLARELAKD